MNSNQKFVLALSLILGFLLYSVIASLLYYRG